MKRRSGLYPLIEQRLDVTLPQYVAAEYPRLGWRGMARDLRERTGITVSYNTLRDWFADRLTVTAELAPDQPAPENAAAAPEERPFRRSVARSAHAA